MEKQHLIQLQEKAFEKVKDEIDNNTLKDTISKSKNLDKIIYTYLHINKVEELQGQVKNLITRDRKMWHDYDKLILLLYYDRWLTKDIHVATQSHHINPGEFTITSTLEEMILDWESSRYTKKDKPYNAYETLNKFVCKRISKESYDRVIDIIDRLELEKDNKRPRLTQKDYETMAKNVTQEDIYNKIIKYVDRVL